MPETILDTIQTELITQGLARDPRTLGDLHPLYKEPRGAVAPKQAKDPTERDDDLVISMFIAPGIPPDPYQEWWRTEGVDFWIRARRADEALAWDDLLVAALNDKRNWMAGVTDASPGERIIESRLFRPRGPLNVPNDPGYTFVTGYLIQHYFPPMPE